LGLVAALAGCGALGGSRPAAELPLTPVVNGPAADFPVVIGSAYEVNGVTYTPADVWNYDEVGYAALDAEGGGTISAAHHTLPLPSYVEVASLETGKTILVRLERRGPMDGNALIALSPGAAEQLGASGNTPVRVRRVNPQEPERAALRSGQRASDRMDTPMSLVNVLKRRLPAETGAPAPGPAVQAASVPAPEPAQAAQADPAPEPVAAENAPEPVSPAADTPETTFTGAFPAQSGPGQSPAEPAVTQAAAPAATAQPTAAARPAAAARGQFVVQAGAFSQKANADRVAGRIGGQVTRSGSLYLVRTGPFATRAQAEASLAKVKASGYSDARIYKGG